MKTELSDANLIRQRFAKVKVRQLVNHAPMLKASITTILEIIFIISIKAQDHFNLFMVGESKMKLRVALNLCSF